MEKRKKGTFHAFVGNEIFCIKVDLCMTVTCYNRANVEHNSLSRSVCKDGHQNKILYLVPLICWFICYVPKVNSKAKNDMIFIAAFLPLSVTFWFHK